MHHAAGAPTSSGCFASTLHENRLVILTTQHSLQPRLPILFADQVDNGALPFGRSGWGVRDTVQYQQHPVFIDCAVIEIDERCIDSGGLRVEDERCAERVEVGARVHKQGAATAATDGIVAAVGETAQAIVAGRPSAAPGQIRVRGVNRTRRFSGAGDSGAVVRNDDGAIIGLIWGMTAAGDTIACPIAPVLWALHIQPVRLLYGDAR